MRKLGRLLYAILHSRVVALLLFALIIGLTWWELRPPQPPPSLQPTVTPAAAPAPPPSFTPPAPEWVTVTTAQGDTVVKAGSAWLLLEPLTTVEIPTAPAGGRWEVRLTEGTLWAFVRKLVAGEEFVVRTPVATAGVRGTRFMVRHNGIQTEIAVEEGTVASDGPGGAIVLAAGEGVVVTPAGARRVPAATILPAWRTGTDRSAAALAFLASAAALRELDRQARAARSGEAPRPANPPGMVRDRDPDRLHGLAPREMIGNGAWTSRQGFGGPVFVAVDLPAGTFSGHFSGTGSRGGVAGTLAGTFSGTYHGDRNTGSFDGTVSFSAASARYNREVPDLSGRVWGELRNGTVTGFFAGTGLDANFTVTGLGEKR